MYITYVILNIPEFNHSLHLYAIWEEHIINIYSNST
jgi:hypothetical protein